MNTMIRTRAVRIEFSLLKYSVELLFEYSTDTRGG